MSQAHHDRPFLQPPPDEPFWRSKEFSRFAGLAGLAIFALLLFAYFGLRQAESARRDQEAASASWPPLSTEERAARLAAQGTLFEGALREAPVAQGFEQSSGYGKMLDSLKRIRPEQVAERAKLRLDWTSVTTDPDPWRGEYVRVRGIVADVWAERLESPVFEHKDVWRGMLTDADGDNGVVFDFLERPANADALRREAVDLEGIYYRNVAYTAENGTQRTAPWILAKNLSVVPAATESAYKATLADNTLLILALLAFAVLGGRVLLSATRSRRRAPATLAPPQSIREVLEANRRRAGIRPPSRSTPSEPKGEQRP
jgi:hypothetical protein